MNISKLNRDGISKVAFEAATKARRAAEMLPSWDSSVESRIIELNSFYCEGQDLANYACETRFTLKALRKMLREYLLKSERVTG